MDWIQLLKFWACWLTSHHLAQRTVWSLEIERHGTWHFSPYILMRASSFWSSSEKWAWSHQPYLSTDASGLLPDDQEPTAAEASFSQYEAYGSRLPFVCEGREPSRWTFIGQYAEPTLSRLHAHYQMNTVKCILQVHGTIPQIHLALSISSKWHGSFYHHLMFYLFASILVTASVTTNHLLSPSKHGVKQAVVLNRFHQKSSQLLSVSSHGWVPRKLRTTTSVSAPTVPHLGKHELGPRI